MIDHLVVGRYYKLNFPPPNMGTPLHINHTDMKLQPNMPMRISTAENMAQDWEKVQPAWQKVTFKKFDLIAHDELNDAKFLYWHPGKVSCTLMPPGSEVMTGPMSGCLLMTWFWNNNFYAGHIGTNTDDLVQTQSAKTAWSGFGTGSGARIIGGFYPDRFLHAGPGPEDGGCPPRNFGVMKHTGECYGVRFFQHGELARCAEIVEIDPLPPGLIERV